MQVNSNGLLDRTELKALMTSLNDGIECTAKEVAWVMEMGSRASMHGITADEARGALALWYPALRRRRRLEELPASPRGSTGRMRRAAAAQMSRHRVEATRVLQDHCAGKVIGRATIHRLLNDLNGGATISDAAVDYVLALADADHSDSIEPEELVTAITIWRTLHVQQDKIERAFDEFDIDHSGKLARQEVRAMLQCLNEGMPVTWTQVDWVIASADTDGDCSLDRKELRAAVAYWYLHVSSRIITPVTGWRAVIPWMLCTGVGMACALLVASISGQWSQQDTLAWVSTALLGLMWKVLVFDPIKVLFCGPLLEPLYALVCGDFEADSLLDTVEDVVETYTEEFTGARVGVSDMDDVSGVAQAVSVAAGNNAIFAMGGAGAGKFQRQVALKRAKRVAQTEMVRHRQDAAVLDKRLGLQHTLSHSRYAEKLSAKRRAAGLSTAAGFSQRSLHSLKSARQLQVARSKHQGEDNHIQLVADMIKVSNKEQQSVHEVLAQQAATSRRRYAGVVATKRRAKSLGIGSFARSSGIRADPLIDILAVSKFLAKRSEAFQLVGHEDYTSTNEVRPGEKAGKGQGFSYTARSKIGFGTVPSARVEIPLSILRATGMDNKP